MRRALRVKLVYLTSRARNPRGVAGSKYADENYKRRSFHQAFPSAWEKGSWADAGLAKPDAIDRTNPAVDQIAARKSDGKTLAVEHTIIGPFVGDKEDFAFFEAALLGIEKDESLAVPGRLIEVFVPVGTLRNQPQVARDSIVQSVHARMDQIESASYTR